MSILSIRRLSRDSKIIKNRILAGLLKIEGQLCH
jgi:hypothetical protein